VKVLSLQQSHRVAAFGNVHHHRSVCLRRVFLAEPRHLGNPNTILFAENLRRLGSNRAVLIQNCRTIGIVYLDWVQLVSHDPETRAAIFCVASLTSWSSASSLQVTLMRAVFLGSLVTAVQRQLSRSAPARISFSIASLITPGCVFCLSSFILEVSIVQYSVSVIVDGVRLLEEKDGRLLGWLVGGVRAMAA
jgi:hypothetical protein